METAGSIIEPSAEVPRTSTGVAGNPAIVSYFTFASFAAEVPSACWLSGTGRSDASRWHPRHRRCSPRQGLSSSPVD